MKIIEVKTGRELKRFLNVPRGVYTHSYPNFIMPLDLLTKDMLKFKNRKEKHLLIAEENGQDVARMAVKTHTHGGHTRLHFGFFECMEGHEAATNALFEYAHSLYPHLEMMGPFHFRMEDPYTGMLAKGFEKKPYFLMPFNPPYYVKYLEHAGLSTAMDLFTYEVTKEQTLPDSIAKTAKEAFAQGITVRSLDPKNLMSEARIVAGIFNDALSQNWGYEEFLEEQVKEMAILFKLFLDHRIIAFAQKDGKDVGCLIMLPNYNLILEKANGKVNPAVIWKYFTQKKNLGELRGYALGVLKSHHGLGIGSALVQTMFDWARKHNYGNCEISWVLANNGPMNELSKAMGGRHDKVYRVFQKSPLNIK